MAVTADMVKERLFYQLNGRLASGFAIFVFNGSLQAKQEMFADWLVQGAMSSPRDGGQANRDALDNIPTRR